MTDTPSFDEIPVLTEVVADKAPVPAIVPGAPSTAPDSAPRFSRQASRWRPGKACRTRPPTRPNNNETT